MSLTKGMNHALMRHSSENPGEHHNVEQAGALSDVLGVSNEISNPFLVLVGEILPCSTNRFRVRIKGRNVFRAKPRQAERQAPITATDLEHAFTAPVEDFS